MYATGITDGEPGFQPRSETTPIIVSLPDNEIKTFFALVSGIVKKAQYNHITLRERVVSQDVEGARKLLSRNRELRKELYDIKSIQEGASSKLHAFDFITCINFSDGLVVDALQVGNDLSRYKRLEQNCPPHLQLFRKSVESHYKF
jgi:hypothetical protein